MLQIDQHNMRITNEQHILEAMQKTSDIAKQIGFSTQQQLLLTLVTEEALTNAYEHSNQEIQIGWTALPSSIEMTVTQVGSLFAIEKTNDVNIEARGRGLQLILHIMDDVKVVQLNNTIVLKMTKSIPSSN